MVLRSLPSSFSIPGGAHPFLPSFLPSPFGDLRLASRWHPSNLNQSAFHVPRWHVATIPTPTPMLSSLLFALIPPGKGATIVTVAVVVVTVMSFAMSTTIYTQLKTPPCSVEPIDVEGVGVRWFVFIFLRSSCLPASLTPRGTGRTDESWSMRCSVWCSERPENGSTVWRVRCGS